jgi:hypothetical protein
VPGNLKQVFWSGLVVRLLAGIALGLVYHFYYGLGDTLGFFLDAVRLNELAIESPSRYIGSLTSGIPPIELNNREPRVFFFTALLSIVNFITGFNYWLSSLWFSLFTFLCAWYLVKELIDFNPQLRTASIIAFLFFPSVVFWSSGIIKESIGFGALCFLAGIFCKLMDGRSLRWQEYLGTAVCIWLLLNLKYYWAAVFFPAVVTSLLVHWFVEKRIRETIPLTACWLLLFVLLCAAASFTHPNFYLEEFLSVIRQNHDEFVAISSPDNLIHFPRQVHQWIDVALNAPLALASGLFRPLPYEAHSPTGVVSSIENLLFLALVVFRLVRPGKVSGTDRLVLLAILAYTVLLCTFLAMSTPNFGTLSRYRIGFLPFLVVVILNDNIAITWIVSRFQRVKTGQSSNI